MRFLLSYRFLYIVSLCLYTDFIGFKGMEVTGCLMFLIAIGCGAHLFWYIIESFINSEEHRLNEKDKG